jgi:hypothetical protein
VDTDASLVWEGVTGGAPGTLTGSHKSWTFKGVDYRGVQVTCSGKLDGNPGKEAPGTMACNATAPSTGASYQCNGPGKMDWQYSIFAGQWAWFGMNGTCVGTANGKGSHFGMVYLHSKLP